MRVGRYCHQAVDSDVSIPMMTVVEVYGGWVMMEAFERVGMATAETLGSGNRDQLCEYIDSKTVTLP